MKFIFAALLVFTVAPLRAQVVARLGAEETIEQAQSVAILRVDGIYKSSALKKSPCSETKEKYAASVSVIRVISGARPKIWLCFDEPPPLDGTILAAAGTSTYPRWVRSFWPVITNTVEPRPHLRINLGDGLDEMAIAKSLKQNKCIEEECKMMEFYPYVLLDDILAHIHARKSRLTRDGDQ